MEYRDVNLFNNRIQILEKILELVQNKSDLAQNGGSNAIFTIEYDNCDDTLLEPVLPASGIIYQPGSFPFAIS